MTKLIKAVTGTRDILPPDSAIWNAVEAIVREVFRIYNFQEIRTPILEDLQLFQRSVGEETDVVSKELYTLQEGTARERELREAWKKQYGPKYTKVTDDLKDGDPEIDFAAYKDGIITLVEVKNRVNLAVVSRLREICKSYQQNTRDTVRMAIAAPSAELAKLKSLGVEDIELHQFQLEAAETQWLALRPENTAGVVRAYIEHNLARSGRLQRFYYIGPQFRRERTQKGRYRQFYQIGAEVIGPSSAGSELPSIDAELLEMLATLLERVGIRNWTLELNSVGCPNDRPKYNEVLRNALSNVVRTMCTDCQRRAVTNPLRVFDCKVAEDQPIIATLPTITDYLDENCRAHFAEVQKILTALGIPFVLNPRLVRGLDYYTRTAFEFTHGALGAQNAILGGGRYDGLSESLGGPPAPGIGFAIGEDRLVMTLQESSGVTAHPADVYIAPLGPGMNIPAAQLARELRRQGAIVTLGDETFKLKKSLETAGKTGARFALIVGENEVNSGQFALKNLATGEQVSVVRDGIADLLKPRP